MQPAASRYTKYTVQAHYVLFKYNINNIRFLNMELFSIGLSSKNFAQNSVLIV